MNTALTFKSKRQKKIFSKDNMGVENLQEVIETHHSWGLRMTRVGDLGFMDIWD